MKRLLCLLFGHRRGPTTLYRYVTTGDPQRPTTRTKAVVVCGYECARCGFSR